VLAIVAKQIGALLIHYSTDFIFDGKKPSPYKEDDIPNPINAYGRSKLMGEQAIQAADMDYVILRTSWVYAARGTNFLRTILKLSQERDELSIVVDQIGAPTWARLVAESTAHVIKQSQVERGNDSFQSGVYHLTASGETSWFGFAEAIVEQARRLPGFLMELNEIRPISTQEYPTLAQRPTNSQLSAVKVEKHFGLRMPSWNVALQLCLAEYR
jgi:dTDP-4-dehydrorhamnose reductase